MKAVKRASLFFVSSGFHLSTLPAETSLFFSLLAWWMICTLRTFGWCLLSYSPSFPFVANVSQCGSVDSRSLRKSFIILRTLIQTCFISSGISSECFAATLCLCKCSISWAFAWTRLWSGLGVSCVAATGSQCSLIAFQIYTLHSGPGGVRYPVFLQCIVIILNLYLVLTKAAIFMFSMRYAHKEEIRRSKLVFLPLISSDFQSSKSFQL